MTAVCVAAGLPSSAQAQDTATTLIAPAIPEGFGRDRNVSVTEQPRPDYDPLGIPYRSFNIFPRVDLGVGATSNAYLTTANPTSAVFGYLSPSIRAQSDWSRNQVVLRADAQLVGYAGESRRNTDSFNLGALGRLDLGGYTSVTTEAQLSRQFETPFSGEVSSNLAILSSYLRNFESVRGQYQAGRFRGIVALDRTGFAFSDIDLGSGRVSQANRDRVVSRLTGQAEWAFSPSVSVYGQGALALTDYSTVLAPGIPNRDSNGYRVIGGVNFDLAGLARGTIGLGYIRRDYHSSLYPVVDGVSVEGRFEYFPSDLTTYTLNLRRVIEDSNLSTTSAFFDNRASLRVDHELLRNLLVNLVGEYARQDYIGSPLRTNVYRVAGGARYLSSRKLALDAILSYTGRSNTGTSFNQRFDEVRGQIGITLQR